jgi:hypothetical protein
MQIGTDRFGEKGEYPVADGFTIEPGGRIVKGHIQDLGCFEPELPVYRLGVQVKLQHRGPTACDVHHPEVATKFIAGGSHDALLFAVNGAGRQRREPGITFLQLGRHRKTLGETRIDDVSQVGSAVSDQRLAGVLRWRCLIGYCSPLVSQGWRDEEEEPKE